MLNIFDRISNKYVITLISFLFISIVGFFDYITGSEISFLLAYLIPIILVSYCNQSEKKLLIINAFFAALVWFTIELLTRDYSNLINPIWNGFVRLIVFTVIGLLILNLKDKYNNVLKLNAELKLLNEEKNKFIGIAAHDLRNPIGAISSFSEILIENNSEKLDAKSNKMLSYIQDLSANSLKMVEDLLNVSNIDSGTIKVVLKKENYLDFMNKYITYNMLVARHKNISIQLETTEKEIVFNFDAHYLAEVINNLLTNAIKFSHKESNIIVKITSTKKIVTTEIIDEGQGIPLEEQGKLFNYFQKTSIQPTNGENSTGLGLAICKKIISEHNGYIGVRSVAGKGSNFYYELPIKN